MPVLLRAGAAQPAVAVGAEDVCCPLLLALGAVLEAERSGVTDSSLIWACLHEGLGACGAIPRRAVDSGELPGSDTGWLVKEIILYD